IEALECPARTAAACDVGLQPEPRLAPYASNGIAGVGSHRPGTDIAPSKVSKLKQAFDVVVPGPSSTPEARAHGVPRLIGYAGIVRRLLTHDAEIVEIDMESGNGADGHDAIKAPEGLPRVGMVVEDAALGNDRGRAEGIDTKG